MPPLPPPPLKSPPTWDRDATESSTEMSDRNSTGANQSTATRLELRDIQRVVARKRRRRRLTLLGILTVLIVAATAGYLNLPDRGGQTSAGGTASARPEFKLRTQETALLKVRAPAGDAVASALLAYDTPKREAAVVLVPNRVAAGGTGTDQMLFGQILRADTGPAQSRSTLSDLLGVQVDASWVLSQSAFADLVSRVGGITADVDVDIVDSDKKVVVPKGTDRQLDGAGAVAVINYRPPGKDELASLPRIQGVLQAVVGKLPAGEPAVVALAEGLGEGSELSDRSRVPRVLDGVRVEQEGERAKVATVPVLAMNAGAAMTYRVEPVATTTLVSRVLAGSARLGEPNKGNRVLAIDGVGKPGFGPTIRDRIVPAGFKLVDTQQESPLGRTKTIIIIFDTTSQSTIRASQLASALGLPDAAVQVSVRTQNIADLIVRVGTDFKP